MYDFVRSGVSDYLLESTQVAHAVDIAGFEDNDVLVQLDCLRNANAFAHQIREVEK